MDGDHPNLCSDFNLLGFNYFFFRQQILKDAIDRYSSFKCMPTYIYIYIYMYATWHVHDATTWLLMIFKRYKPKR